MIHRIAAFTAEGRGGNPAGVVLGEALPDPDRMQAIAVELGYSETAFAVPEGDKWRVKYYAPVAEVDFCGHATIALGAVMGDRLGKGDYDLLTNAGPVGLSALGEGRASLLSPPTQSTRLEAGLRDRLMGLFDLVPGDLDPRLPPLMAMAGNRHPVFALATRARLAAMAYPFAEVRALMQAERLTTICLIHAETDRLFHARNAFAIGGVVEDPATGAAAAALGGALLDQGWPGMAQGAVLTLHQGVDMGVPCHLRVEVSGKPNAPVGISGATRGIAL